MSLNLTQSEFQLLHEKVSDQVKPSTPSILSSYDETKCMARTYSGIQCSRKKQKDTDFCGSHIHSQPYGRIDHDRKPTQPPALSSSETHSSAMIPLEMTVETFDGIEYLVDPQSGRIFKRRDGRKIDEGDDELDLNDLMVVGQKVSTGTGNNTSTIRWYSEHDLVFLNKKN